MHLYWIGEPVPLQSKLGTEEGERKSVTTRTILRNRSFWPKKITQKKSKLRQNQIRDKTA